MTKSNRDSEEWHDAVMCAFNEAIDGLELWEYGGADSQEEADMHKEAARDVAKRIKNMRDRYDRKYFTRTIEESSGGSSDPAIPAT